MAVYYDPANSIPKAVDFQKAQAEPIPASSVQAPCAFPPTPPRQTPEQSTN